MLVESIRSFLRLLEIYVALLISCSTQESDLFPLRDSVFEATRVKIPFDYAWLLEEEYGMESLTRTEYER